MALKWKTSLFSVLRVDSTQCEEDRRDTAQTPEDLKTDNG